MNQMIEKFLHINNYKECATGWIQLWAMNALKIENKMKV